jgi:CubicO group peptidase (beta-lactamase class C family)
MQRFLPGPHVRVRPAEEVTSVNPAEAPARLGGLAPADVEEIWRSVTTLYRTGLHPAIALCVRRRGQLVLDRAIGHLSGNAPGDAPEATKVPIRHDSLFNLFSSSKAITAMVVHLLDQQGKLHVDDHVTEYIPEFGRHGKDWVTIRHLLTHRAGIPAVVGTKTDLALLTDPKRILQILCDAKPASVPGRQLAYHAVTGGFVIGEIVKRVTGRDLRQVLGEELLASLGFKTFNYGVPPERVSEVAVNAFTGTRPPALFNWLLARSLGVGVQEATALSNEPAFLTAIIPSANIIGTAEEGSRFFELLLREGELNGTRIFERRTVRRAVAEQSYLELDAFLGLPIRYAMGFMLGSKWFSPYGADSPHAFGHIGFTNVLSYADPDRDISVCLMTSGKPFITPGQVMWINVARTIARRCPPVPRD